jgi:prolipoprotein diacylglyceryltransferase
LRGREGQAAALFVGFYGVHRFLNELLRSDPRPIGLESNTSVMLVLMGILLWLGLQFATLPIRQVPEPEGSQ